MPLKESDERLLRSNYDLLAEFLIDGNKKNWLSEKENIITFCVEHEIHLYNISSLKLFKSTEPLTNLLAHFSLLKVVSAEDPGWKREALAWKREFEENVRLADLAFVRLHDEAYLSVGDQYIKTHKVSPTTLLTINDIATLFANPAFRTDDILLTEPFSLADHSLQLEERVQKLIRENDQDKTIFMPITHQGHWFYLLKQQDAWVIRDSQPFLEGDEFSQRQASIQQHSIEFIKHLTGSSSLTVIFETTGEQNNNYDCGTQVTNAYRSLADRHHERQTHKNILIELAQSQVLPKERLPQNIEEIFGPRPVIQPEISSPPKSPIALKKETPPLSLSGAPIISGLSVSSDPLVPSDPLGRSEPSRSQIEVLVQLTKKPKRIPEEFTQVNFLLLLAPIKEKQRIRLSQYPSANRAVNRLNEIITGAANEFYQGEFSEDSLIKFETKCTQAINAADRALGSHRDTLGVLFAGIKNFFVVLWKNITGSSEREHRLKFFDGRTASAKILQDLRDDIHMKQDQYRDALPSLD